VLSSPKARRLAGFDFADLFTVIAATGLVFAFVGLSTSSYWTDELFTLFLIDHHGGLAEVWRRALTDTHPPLFYTLAYGWSKLFGLSETAMRSLTAILATGAVAVFYLGLAPVFSARARTFAAASAVVSWFWMFQSQNLRNYSLSMLFCAALIAFAVRLKASTTAHRRVSWTPLSLLTGAALLGSFTHFYVFLYAGFVLAFLILTCPSWRVRALLAAAGLVILALNIAYIRLLMSSTQQDIHHMWFRADAKFFLGQIKTASKQTFTGYTWVALALLIGTGLSRRYWDRDATAPSADPASPARRLKGWTAALCGSALAGVLVTGIVISLLFAPSFSGINVLTGSPFIWSLFAGLYDWGLPTQRSWIVNAVLAACLATSLVVLKGRWLPQGEAWRESSQFIDSVPACRSATIPVVNPPLFGPRTPFFDDLVQRRFYGFYDREPSRLRVYTGDQFAAPPADLAQLYRSRISDARACPILAWAVHNLDQDAAQTLLHQVAQGAHISEARLDLHAFDLFRRRGLSYRPRLGGVVVMVKP
jgi:hypothetical protein